MIEPISAHDAPMPSSALQENASGAAPKPAGESCAEGATASGAAATGLPPQADPILCNHCGRTASNGISCQGICVADSGY